MGFVSSTLGLSFGIDSAASLIRDGRIDSAAMEERFDRIKHSRSFPKQALAFCLRRAGVGLESVDDFAFFWNPGEHVRQFDSRRAMTYRDHREFLELVPAHLLALSTDSGPVSRVEQTFHFAGSRRPMTVHFISHHLCHAAAAFYPSRFESAAILTVDGYGERTSLMMARGTGNQIETLADVSFPHSLGSVYAAVTEHLGFKANCDEGKVMALASFAEPEFSRDFEELIRLTGDGRFEVDLDYFAYYRPSRSRCSDRFRERFGPPRQKGEPLERRHEQLAASLQNRLEEALIHAASELHRRTGERRLVMAGGVSLNTVANSRILAETEFEELHVCPPASDGGAAMGAALYVAHALRSEARPAEDYSDYLGPDYSDQEIRAALDAAGARYREVSDPAEEAARLIARGSILGWFQGRTEFGPRALGNRSILADPRRAEMKDRVNARVKHREAFRPFAPACPEEAASRYFLGQLPSPYMMRTFGVVEGEGENLGAVLHVDGTARLQTVSREQNPLFHRLLHCLEPHIGLPVVLNTSFNDSGEPIVNTPAEALRCFASTGLDALVVGNFVLCKEEGSQ